VHGVVFCRRANWLSTSRRVSAPPIGDNCSMRYLGIQLPRVRVIVAILVLHSARRQSHLFSYPAAEISYYPQANARHPRAVELRSAIWFSQEPQAFEWDPAQALSSDYGVVQRCTLWA